MQYAHARTCNVAPASAGGRACAPQDGFDPVLLTHETEAALLGVARRVPAGGRARRPSCASRTGSPATSRSSPAPTTVVRRRAACCPKGDEEITDLHRTRLWLNDATRQVLANGLGLLGVSAPERM